MKTTYSQLWSAFITACSAWTVPGQAATTLFYPKSLICVPWRICLHFFRKQIVYSNIKSIGGEYSGHWYNYWKSILDSHLKYVSRATKIFYDEIKMKAQNICFNDTGWEKRMATLSYRIWAVFDHFRKKWQKDAILARVRWFFCHIVHWFDVLGAATILENVEALKLLVILSWLMPFFNILP